MLWDNVAQKKAVLVGGAAVELCGMKVLEHHALRDGDASDAQLGQLIERLHSQPLDLSKPLWEAYVIEGLADEDVPAAKSALASAK